MRGGTANCTVKYSNDSYIYNPSPETPDLLLAMNHMFEKKGKSKFNESNARAFDAGFNAV